MDVVTREPCSLVFLKDAIGSAKNPGNWGTWIGLRIPSDQVTRV